jgi:hypothetical protein
MSGTIIAPASITRTQAGVSVPVEVVSGLVAPPPPGVPPYPLATDPAQTWFLTYVGGVLTWVQTNAAPALSVWALEDARGLFLLEDGAGFLLLEA